jgi:transcriptional regulator of heat shock response
MSKKILPSKESKLSPRQTSILFAMVKEYCNSGKSIGSKELQEKYGFECSSATIRNELVALRKSGFLYQPFTNSSSRPTEKAYKIFINQLILGLQATHRQQQKLKQQILELEENQFKLNKELSRLLAGNTGGVGFAVDERSEDYAGIANLVNQPSEGRVVDILDFLDNLDNHKQHLLSSYKKDDLQAIDSKSSLQAYVGQENPILPLGKGYAMILAKIEPKDSQKSVVGLIAPPHLLARKKNLELVDAISKIFQPDKKAKKNSKPSSKSSIKPSNDQSTDKK